jgi:pimeloyl-ACP methyl ester carboxylesterase
VADLVTMTRPATPWWLAVIPVLALLLWSLPATVSAQPAAWFSCGGNEAAECTWLEVPLDHADPDSGPVALLVKRLPARDPQQRQGVLVTIAGGPGQRGTDGVRAAGHTPAIRDAFDIVSWDPRGTSHESLIDCIPGWDPYIGLDRTPDTPSEQQALDGRSAELVSACLDAHETLLPFVGSWQTALDLELLRVLLDEPEISVLGSSYGSQVAALYASLFPDRVRAVVLDGYSDPNQSPGAREVEQAAAFERRLDALLADCALDSACALGHGGDPGQALDELLLRLDQSPILVDSALEGTTTESDAYEAIVGALARDRRAQARLVAALAAAVDGDGVTLSEMAARVRADYTSSGLTAGAFAAIYCADTATWWASRSGAQIDDLARQVQDEAPRLGRWLWSPPGSLDLPPVALCAMQPGPSTTRIDAVDAAGAGPILVLATTGDPNTPIEAARRALGDLEEASLVVLEREHHLAYPWAVRDPAAPDYHCLLETIETYLIDLELPVVDRPCAETAA